MSLIKFMVIVVLSGHWMAAVAGASAAVQSGTSWLDNFVVSGNYADPALGDGSLSPTDHFCEKDRRNFASKRIMIAYMKPG